jgi:hypothetical protein
MAIISKSSAVFTETILMWKSERKVQGMTIGQTNKRVRKEIREKEGNKTKLKKG